MDERDEQAVNGIRESLAAAIERLRASGARDEALAVFIPRHRRMLLTREAVLQSSGRVWRLGVLLLDSSGTLYATAAITRATPPGRPAFQSVSAETRREFRAAAMRGRFTVGETVNYDAAEIELTAANLRESTGPLRLVDGRALVRWNPTTTATLPFESYLAERVGLLVAPPQGA